MTKKLIEFETTVDPGRVLTFGKGRVALVAGLHLPENIPALYLGHCWEDHPVAKCKPVDIPTFAEQIQTSAVVLRFPEGSLESIDILIGGLQRLRDHMAGLEEHD